MQQARSIRVFDFTDYRKYLAGFYAEAKAMDRRFSHRYVNRNVGAASAGWFGDLLRGRINLTPTYMLRLTGLLGLGKQEAEYFECMVAFAQAPSLEERVRHQERMAAAREMPADVLGKDKAEYYSRWHHAALRELLFIHDFTGDYKALARRLDPPITEAQAKRSVALLLRLGLVAADERGRVRPMSSVVKKDSSFKSEYLSDFLRANMRLGMDALDRVAKDARDISSLTLALSEADLEKAREEIRALRKKLLGWSQRPTPPAKVFQCNFQIFPVSS
jgi:uncharacterized protein (TIGR02147 family)